MTENRGENGELDLGIAGIKNGLARRQYICDDNVAAILFIAERMQKPLLIEGPAGVGKTDLARAYSQMRGLGLIRLQCYEGLDEAKAIYEWNYKKQLLHIQAVREKEWESIEDNIFSEPFLIARPLLQAITSPTPVVLLIDEIDKVDQEFEAMLLELLGDWQITVPEIGTIRAKHPPVVFLTSNRSRELSEALKRRCLYLYMEYPSQEREKEIILNKLPNLDKELAGRIAAFVKSVRELDLHKPPSITETLDWAAALLLAGSNRIDSRALDLACNILVKHYRDSRYLAESIKCGIISTG
jgi:MoxR-like ATPase